MLKPLKFIFVLLIAQGCRREYAHFQNTASDNYPKPKKQVEKPVNTLQDLARNDGEEIAPLPMPDFENITAGIETDTPIEKNQLNNKTDLFPKGLFKKKTQGPEKKKPGFFQKPEKKGIFQKKKSKKRGGLSHRSVVRLEIGFVLLGIAVVFALLHITILAIIFGILSAFMIIRGLRKLL